ncbi:MAG TPA: polysaccharide pyruvyl transferase family protein [Bacteroidia bacterium]|nr:polysaccharide pyruvyl transferase family protein [Bacteroidia bacterium]
MNKPYIILTGGLKNVGDYLIAYRAKKLIEEYVTTDIIEYNRWEKLDDYLEIINSSKGIIICGGPGFSENMYPNTYPLVENLEDIKVPITTLGVGWSGFPINRPEEFKFTKDAHKLMQKIHNSSAFYACRDEISELILKKEGYSNTLMTGCPVWYDLDNLNKELKEKKEIKKIVFTTPADQKLIFQVIKLINMLKKKFPNAIIYNSFHRGIEADKYTSWKGSLVYKLMAKYGELRGLKTVDTSYDLSKIDFYEDCDLHIGYRVHAHLYFLSKRLPSILLSEDGRGVGMSEALNTEIFKVQDKNIINKVSNYLDTCIKNNYSSLQETSSLIDNNFTVMEKFLKSLKSWT